MQKYTRITHRFELIKRRSTPSIICKPAPKIDFEGDGGSSPEVTILYSGHMPYCGPTFGLSHMHVITEHVNKAEEDEDDTKSEHSAKSLPRKTGKGLKRGAPGADMTPADPQSPDENGDGLFKSGTPVHKGIFRCPTDMQLDTPHGHTQSEVLDLISEAISRLRQIESALTGSTSPRDFVKVDDKEAAEAKEKMKGEVAAAAATDENKAKKTKGAASSSTSQS